MRRWSFLTPIGEIDEIHRAHRLLPGRPMRPRSVLLAHLVITSACSTEPPPPPVEPVQDGCPPLFDQEVLQDFYVDIDDQEWSALEQEFLHRGDAIAAGQDPNPYHPTVFRHDGDVVEDAMIRLHGASSWDEAIALDDDPKMQFVISFNENSDDGRYRGARKLVLDMPRTDATFLRHRLALYGLRSIGVPAQCANSARLFINDDYYGLYTNVERMDRELLERLFPEAPDGDLWEGGRFIKTNEDDFSWDRLEAFWAAGEDGSLADRDRLADLEASVRVWAAEAVLPDADGYYMGRANFYLYDHPSRGFLWLPEDLDSAFDFVRPDIDAMFPVCSGQVPDDRMHYLLVMDDPTWRDRYLAALREELKSYDPADMVDRLEQWAGQIAQAAADDPHKPFSTDDHETAVSNMRSYFPQRAYFLSDWLACRRNGGRDSDGDGADFCRDCDDSTADFGPDVAETCNAMDDDCDGHIDEVADCAESD
jgi:hypothetical protein